MMVRPYSTVRDWLWHMQERGFRGRHDKKRGRRKCKMPGAMFKEVRCWLKEPSNFGFESGPWQLNLLLELIKRNFGLDCNMHMLRRWLCRIRISWRKNGHVSYRTASKREQKEFQQKAREQTRLNVSCLQKTRLQSRCSRILATAGCPRGDVRRTRGSV